MSIIWNADKITEGLIAVQKEHAGIMAFLKELLNDYHGVQRSESYYDLLAGDWLDKFVHTLYAAWQTALLGHPIDKDPSVWVFPTTPEYGVAVSTPEFHDRLQVMTENLLTKGSAVPWRFEREQVIVDSGSADWRKKLMADLSGSKRPQMIICAPYIRCSKREWIGTLWRWRRWAKWDELVYPIKFSCPIDQDWRRARSQAVFQVDGFSGLLRALMPLCIPAALLEGFPRYREEVLGLKLWRPQMFYTANALHGSLAFKVLAAEWRMEGTKLLNHQHGGGYGITRTHVLEDFETRVSDRFYSWGWRRAGSSVVPMSAAYPVGYRAQRRRILFLSVTYPVTMLRLQHYPQPGTLNILKQNVAAFLSTFPENKDLLVRYNKQHYGSNPKAIIQSVAPWVDFDEEMPSIFQRFAESRLVIHAYISTSWLETLALDIPTICFFDPDIHLFRAEAQPYLNALQQVGIIQHSGKDAANFASTVMADPQGWWQKPDVQEARQSFVRNYANFSPDWVTQWEEEFQQWMK